MTFFMTDYNVVLEFLGIEIVSEGHFRRSRRSPQCNTMLALVMCLHTVFCCMTMSGAVLVKEVLAVGLELNGCVLGLLDASDRAPLERNILGKLLELFRLTGTPLVKSFRKKLEHNKKKYDVKAMRASLRAISGDGSVSMGIEKYTTYSRDTGVTKISNDTEVFLLEGDLLVPGGYFSVAGIELDRLRDEAEEFARERGWDESTYSLPRIACVLISELGEFFDAIQWQDPCARVSDLSLSTRNRLGAELADVFICYLQYSWSHSKLQRLSGILG